MHLDDTHRSRWISQLLELELLPELLILDDDMIDEDAFAREVEWIAWGRACGWPLTNMTDGGDGSRGYTFTEERKEAVRQFMLGRRHSLGWSPTAEQRAKLSEAKRGNQYVLGQTRTAEQRERMRIAANVRWERDEYRANHRAAMQGNTNFNQPRQCSCGYESNAGNVAQHKRRAGHE